jgi:hypothetical protein
MSYSMEYQRDRKIFEGENRGRKNVSSDIFLEKNEKAELVLAYLCPM